MEIDLSAADVTVSVTVGELIPCMVAPMAVEPAATGVATPWLLLAELSMVAMLVADDPHVTVPVMSCVDVSEKVPVAVNACVVPSGTVALAGATTMDVSVAALTVSDSCPVTLPSGEVAVMTVLPGLTAVAKPLPATETTPGLDDSHDAVIGWLVPSE